MRILVSGKFYPDSFARCIATTAELMGHAVRTFEDQPIHRHQNRLWVTYWTLVQMGFPEIERRRLRRLCKVAREFEPDLILFPHAGFSPEVVRDIRESTNARLAVWYPDAIVNLGRQYMLAADYDAWFFKDPYMADTFREKLGLNAHYLPEACHSQWHRRIEPSEKDRKRYGCDLATASNMYYYRAKTMEAFRDYDLKIWGTRYPRWLESPLRDCYPGIYVAEEEKARALTQQRLCSTRCITARLKG